MPDNKAHVAKIKHDTSKVMRSVELVDRAMAQITNLNDTLSKLAEGGVDCRVSTAVENAKHTSATADRRQISGVFIKHLGSV